ncbi:MAG: NAD-dependent epimerase/dehydratase family protein [Sphingobacteriaceae bacterium]|nr:MAG: NAD-dependent epimerase/dehydratase family protein [Sphingobacteriaceae bacterium]
MNKKILVAGATGDLGGRIVKALLAKNAEVIALVRPGADQAKTDQLTAVGATVIKADTSNFDAVKEACTGVSCVVSALAGLREVIVDAQSLLLDAAVAAGVPRFIPSDYSTNFTDLPAGENRNFDLRKEFHQKLDQANIAYTAIFIGAFSDILMYGTPLYNLKNNTIGFWGENPDFKLDFTTKDNTAEYTAAAAMDDQTPKFLQVASFQISPNELAALAKDLKNTDFKLVPMGDLAGLSAYNKSQRAADPEGENQLYPKWQQSQYMYSMFSIQNLHPDNNRYPEIKWTTARDVLARF